LKRPILLESSIAELIPQQGAMCLLEAVESCSDETIVCRSRSHLLADNPLRRGGRLSAWCGIEYGLQAAALHGALTAGKPTRGYLVALSEVDIRVDRLDDMAVGTLRIEAIQDLRQETGLIYRFRISAEDGRLLLGGQATIASPSRSR
jgi:predicted hotdog family 3-hydroxylacyl-ACP dehydratase